MMRVQVPIPTLAILTNASEKAQLTLTLTLTVGLPTLDLGIPGRPPLPSRPFPSLPPLPPFPLPSLLPVPRGLHPIPARGSGERCKLPSRSGAKPQPTNDFVHISEPKGAALVATVIVHCHNNKFKFLYKHKTA